MQPLTLSRARTEIANIAGLSGMSVTDSRLTEVIKYVMQVFWPELNHPNIVRPLRFTNVGGTITLPEEFQTALRFDVREMTRPIANMWYEFTNYGPGRQDGTRGWSGIPIDQGDVPAIRQPDTEDTDGGQLLRCLSLGDERVSSVAPTIRLLGKDVNGRLIRSLESSAYVDGTTLALNGHLASPSNETTTAMKFSELLGVIAPRTNFGFELYWVDSAGAETLAGRYSHKAGSAAFRQYYCPGVAEDDEEIEIAALCRRRYQPPVDDNELIYLSNVRALRLGAMAERLEKQQKFDEANAAWASAIGMLRAESEEFHADDFPQVETQPLTGFAEEQPLW